MGPVEESSPEFTQFDRAEVNPGTGVQERDRLRSKQSTGYSEWGDI